jgi:hypothetical protein
LKNKYFFDIDSDLIKPKKRRVHMGLVMVCPQCQAKVLLQSQNCPYCQTDLRNVPQDQRRYVVGKPGPSTPPAASAPAATEAIPVLAPAGVPEAVSQPAASEEVRIRRPFVRRYAAPPVSALSQNTAKPAKAAKSKPEAKKAKKPKAATSKKKK